MIRVVRFLSAPILCLFIVTFFIKVSDAAVNNKLTAVFYGNGGYAMNEVTNLTSWSGKRPAVLVFFTDWCPGSISPLFSIQMNNIWNNKNIPLITWEPFGCNAQSQPGITQSIRNGANDSYINQFSDSLKTWLAGSDGIYGTNDDRRVYLRLAHEMNGNWYPWSQQSTSNDYIMSWRHIHDIFVGKGLNSTRVQWVWCVNNGDVGQYKAEDYYPGDNYVDWTAIDGYNFGATQSWSSWASPNQVFDNMIGRLRVLAPSKPLAITEYGCTSIYSAGAPNVSAKSNWLNSFCTYLNTNQIKLASYFNIEKETDWAIFGGSRGDAVWNGFNVYTAYKNCLQSSDWIQSSTTNSRLITDDQFAGKL